MALVSDWQLFRLGPGDKKRCIKLKVGENTVGRLGECDIVLLSPLISRHHCSIFVTNDANGVFIRNLSQSANGTFINGTKIDKENTLVAKDSLICFGARGLNYQTDKDEFIYKLYDNKTIIPTIIDVDKEPDLVTPLALEIINFIRFKTNELPSLTDREPSFIDPDICEISDDESPQISNLEVVATTLKDLRVILPRSNPADLVKRYESQCQKDNKKENEKDDKKEKQNHGAVYSRDRAISSDSDSSESELRKIADGDDDCDDFNYAPPSRSPIDRSAPLPSAKKKIKETQQIQKKLSLICDSEDDSQEEKKSKKHNKTPQTARKRIVVGSDSDSSSAKNQQLPKRSRRLSLHHTANEIAPVVEIRSSEIFVKKPNLGESFKFPKRSNIRRSVHFNTEEPLKITIKTLPPEEKVRPRRPSLIAPSPARSSYESNPQPSTSSAPLPDPSVMDKRARKSSLFDDSPAKIVRPRRSSTFVPRSAYLDVDSDDNAPQPSTSIADPVLGKRARESSLVDHSSKRVRPRRLSTFLSSSAYLDVDSDDNAPQPSNAPVPLQLPKDSSAEAKKIKFMNALPQKPQKRSRTQKLVIPESNTISVIQAPTPEPSPSPSTSKAALVSTKRLFETNPPAKRTLPARRQSCFETNLDEISGAMKLKMKRNQNQSVVKPKLFGSELVDARKKKLSELVRKKKVEKMDKDVQVNTKQAPKQTNMPLNQEIVASKSVVKVKLTEKTRNDFLLEATKAPRQLPRRQSTHQRDVVKERRQALATNKAAVPPTAPAIARPSINAEMPAKEIPKMPPLIKISTVNPPAPVNTNLSVIPNFYNERYSEPTKLSSNVLVNGVPEIGMKTFNRVAHKEKSSSSSEVEKSVNSTEAIKNHPSNNSHTSSPAHPEPEPSTSHGRNIRRTFPKVLPTSHQALKSILKATNRSRRSIKRNIAFKQDLCVVHEREPTEEEIAAWKLELQTHDRVPCLDIGLEQNFPNIYRAAVLLAENKILPRVDNQLIEEPPIIHNMRTCYDKYEIVDFREDILSNINEEFSHSLLEKYLEKAKNPNCWEEATIRSQTEPDSQNTFISCYFKNRDFVQMGYLTLIKMKEVNKNYCYSLAYVSNVFKKDRSSCFSIIQLEIPKTGLPIAQGDVLNLMHIVYIKSDLKQFQTIATLECNELVKLMMSPKNMVQLSPTTIKYTGKDELNMEQQDIVMKQAQNNDISRGDSFITVIEGCPGSGKSRVIKNIVVETLKAQTRDDKAVLKLRSKKNMFRTRILVCAKSNACVDEITEKLIDAQDESHVKFEVLRLGDTNKMTEKAKKVSLAEKIKQTTFELNQLNHISKEQRNEIKEKIIERCQVVTSTINSSFNANNLYRAYDIVIIDEATQCSLADLSIPLYFKPYKLILIGDTKQLGINLKSRALVNTRFDLSLLERIIKCHPKKDRTPIPINHLNVQYRMHPDILMFPNREFYENRLTTAHCVMNRTFPLHPYGMFSLQCNQNMTQDISRNTYNSEEVLFVMHLLMTIEAIVDQAEFSIGVITPYSRHKSEMIKCFKKREFRLHNVTFDTVDSTPSIEKDIVILSTAKTEGQSFLCEPRRLNVALTRARHSLWICGNFEELEKDGLWNKLMTDAKKRKLFHEIDQGNTHNLEGIIKNDLF